jgi:hypothetical protein
MALPPAKQRVIVLTRAHHTIQASRQRHGPPLLSRRAGLSLGAWVPSIQWSDAPHTTSMLPRSLTNPSHLAPAGIAQLPVKVVYRALADRKLAIPPDHITLTALGRDVPVFVERPLMDFKCCMFGQLYRDQLVLRNVGKAAMKVAVAKRPELDGSFEFYPAFGYCQVGGASEHGLGAVGSSVECAMHGCCGAGREWSGGFSEARRLGFSPKSLMCASTGAASGQ